MVKIKIEEAEELWELNYFFCADISTVTVEMKCSRWDWNILGGFICSNAFQNICDEGPFKKNHQSFKAVFFKIKVNY